MIYPGLVSISFRKLTTTEIIDLVKRTNLKAIEWGGDVHVPHGNLTVATAVKKMTKNANLKIASYGSYYFAGESERQGLPFSDVLNTALELEAPTIRVWAGTQGSDEVTPNSRRIVIEDLDRIANIAKKHNISISLEYHSKTLTDTNESAFKLNDELKNDNVFFYWQPPVDKTCEYCLNGLKTLRPRLTNIHVYHWAKMNKDFIRYPLSEGVPLWRKYFAEVSSDYNDHYALLEFVLNDKPEQMIEDSNTLIELLK